MSNHGIEFRKDVPLMLVLVCANAALAYGPLFPGAQYEVGEIPYSVAVGDLNRDGWSDLAVANARIAGAL